MIHEEHKVKIKKLRPGYKGHSPAGKRYIQKRQREKYAKEGEYSYFKLAGTKKQGITKDPEVDKMMRKMGMR